MNGKLGDESAGGDGAAHPAALRQRVEGVQRGGLRRPAAPRAETVS